MNLTEIIHDVACDKDSNEVTIKHLYNVRKVTKLNDTYLLFYSVFKNETFMKIIILVM